MFDTFSTDTTNISSCVGIGIGCKSIVKLNICAQPMHQIFIIKYCIFLKTIRIRMSYQARVWLS